MADAGALRASGRPAARPDRLFDRDRLRGALARWRPPLLYGLRFWASVSLALYIAFELQLGEPYWAGTSAGIACLPQVGASLRKGWFRVIGTLLGASMSVVVSGLFPQDRDAFLIFLVLWAGASAFATTLLRNFAAYGAALSGYTLAIIAGGALGATGGIHGDAVFDLAVARASEIILGIACAGVLSIVLDTGDAQKKLVTLIAGVSAEVSKGFRETLAPAADGFRDMQAVRRGLVRQVIALDPVIDLTLGESSRMRYYSPVLQRTVDGLFGALVAWRAVAIHLASLPEEEGRRQAQVIRQSLTESRTTRDDLSDPSRWIADPMGLRRGCQVVLERLGALPADTPSLRLLADKSAELVSAMSYALNGLGLLASGEPPDAVRGHRRLRVPDTLPALVNALRASVTVGVAALLWIATAWPHGMTALIFAMVVVIAQAPRAGQAYASSLTFGVAIVTGSVLTTVVALGVLPAIPTNFVALSLTLGVFLIPLAALSMLATKQWLVAGATAMTTMFVPLLAPTNLMVYDGVARFNQTIAFVVGCSLAALAFRVIPALPSSFLARRLLRLTRDDLHRLAGGDAHDDWSDHILGRLVAMPPDATPLQTARLVVALSVGDEIVQLRSLALSLGVDDELEFALAAFRRRDSREAAARLSRLDATLAQRPATSTILHARASIIVLTDALTQHKAYFDADEPADGSA